MTTRTIAISTDDLAALHAIRPVIADAHAHPGRAAAIAALDRIAGHGLPEDGHLGAAYLAARRHPGRVAEPPPRPPVRARRSSSRSARGSSGSPAIRQRRPTRA
jgi:hypothetical protein